MSPDCKDVPVSASQNCSNPWGIDCKSHLGFNFVSLWNYTQNIQRVCPQGPRLLKNSQGRSFPKSAALTQAACTYIAGATWKPHAAIDIWQRLTTWKFPLLQLIFIFPRPPLSFTVESFVIFHLVGDPIGTTRNLLDKLAQCQEFSEYWCHRRPENRLIGLENNEDWKALALVTDAFAEWDKGDALKRVIRQAL